MKASRHGDDWFAADGSENQFSLVPFNSRYRKMRDLVVTQFMLYFYFLHKISKTASEHYTDFRTCCIITLKKCCSFLKLIDRVHCGKDNRRLLIWIFIKITIFLRCAKWF